MAATGKKSTTSLSQFTEAYGLEVEEGLSTMATQYWQGVLTGKWSDEQKEAWMRQIREVQTWIQVRGRAGAVMCETRDLGIKWPYWHTLMFSQEIQIDMRFVCPKNVKKSAGAWGPFNLLEEVDSKVREQRVERESMNGTRAISLAKVRENGTEKHRNVFRKIF